MFAAVDLCHELLTGLLQLRERGVLVSQVRVSGDQVGLRQPDCGLRAALGLRVERDTRVDLSAVVAGDFHDLRMSDRDAGDMVDSDGFGVVSQHKRRHPTQPAQGGVQAGDQRRLGLVPDRDHHPEPGPRQPGAEQQRRPQLSARTRHPGALAPVELQPQARLSDPRPIRAPVPSPPSRLHLRDRASGGAFRPGEPHPDQPGMDHIRADLALAGLDPVLNLRHEPIQHPRPPARTRHRPTRIPRRDIPTHRLRIHPRQQRSRVRTLRGVERLQNFHDLPVRLLHVSLRWNRSWW